MEDKNRKYLIYLLFLSISLLFCTSAAVAVPGISDGNATWWDANATDTVIWTTRIPVSLAESKLQTRVNEPVTLKAGELFGNGYDYGRIRKESLRVIDPGGAADETGEIGGNDVPFQVVDVDADGRLSSSDLIVFLTNVTAGGTKTYYLYYSADARISGKAYPTITWNLAVNPGFETGTGSSASSWLLVGSGYSRISSGAHTGTYSIRMSAPDTLSSYGIREKIAVSPNKTWESITIGAWAKVTDVSGYRDKGLSIYTDTYYTKGALYAQTPVFEKGTHDWALYESTIYPTGSVKEIDPCIFFGGHSGTVLLDDITVIPCAYKVSIGEREDSGMVIKEPSSIHIFSFTDPVDVVVQVKDGVSLTGSTVNCTLTTPNNGRLTSFSLYNDGSHGDATGGDDLWTAGGVIPVSPATGIWTLTCTATDTRGYRHVSERQFLMVPDASTLHPRLYFTASDLPGLRSKMQQEPTSSTWNAIKDTALTFNSFPSGINDGDAQWNAWTGLRYTAFYYALTGDQAVGNRGKTWLLKVCAWPSWTPREAGDVCLVNYDTGKIAIAVGEAYDMLYPLLTDPERETVRRAIVEKAVEPAYIDYMNGNYWDDTRTNRGAQAYGGIGVAALAIMGEDASNPNLDPFFNATKSTMKEYLDSYDPDGASSEGISYQSYGLCDGSGALYYLEAYRRVLGVNLYQHANFKNAMDFPLYFLPPDRKSASEGFGDTSFNVGYSAGAIALLTSEFEDGHAKWYANNAPLYHYDNIGEFIWYDGSVPELSPVTLPESKLFRGVGWAAMRTGWNLTDSMISFRSGPVLPGHNRPEQNSFTLDAYGERLIIEPGMPSGGYSDPAYASYYGATLSQNTILVNGDPHSQSEKTIDGNVGSLPAGAVTEFLGTDLYDEVIGNATAAYQGKLAAFNRHIVYLKPDHVVILDQLESASGPLEYDSLWHFPGNAISVSGDNITITRNGVKLYARVFIPSFSASVGSGQPVKIGNTEVQTSYIKMYSALPAANASYLYVLSPVNDGGAVPEVTRIQNGTVTGVVIQDNGTTNVVLFNPKGMGIAAVGVVTDGNKAYVCVTNNTVTSFAIHNGKKLSFNGTSLFDSSSTTSIAASCNIPFSASAVNMTSTVTPTPTGTPTPSATPTPTGTAISPVINKSASQPDLIITSLDGPSSIKVGNTGKVTATIKNSGPASITTPFVTKFYLSSDTVITSSDIELGQKSISSLKSGYASSISISVRIPEGTKAGKYYIGAIVDANGVVSESQEENNMKYDSSPVTIKK